MCVPTRGVTVPTFVVEWHTSPTCSPEFLTTCEIAAASLQHPGFPSASCVLWQLPSHRRPVQLASHVESLSVYFPIGRTLAGGPDF